MTLSGLHETVKRSPDSSDQDEFRPSRCAGSDSYTQTIQQDREFVHKLIDGESGVWKTFLNSYQKLIYNRVLLTCEELGRTAKKEMIEDCCSEVLTKLFENDLAALKRFQGKSRLSTWLSVVTRRIALRYLFKAYRTEERAKQGDSHFDIQTIPETRVETVHQNETAEIQWLQACLQELSEVDRKTLLLHSQEKMSYEDIGQELGISANSVGPKLARARKRLKKLMEQRRNSSSPHQTHPPDVDDKT